MSHVPFARRQAMCSACGRCASIFTRFLVLVLVLTGPLSVAGFADEFTLEDIYAEDFDSGGGGTFAPPPIYELPQTQHSQAMGSKRVEASGIQFRAGHLGFRTFGRDESISNIELFPYTTTGDEMFFGDLRLFLTNRSRFGGNAGLGYRRRLFDLERIVGASVWYDGDDSVGSYFQQMGVSFESYGEWLDLRSNLYFPFGRTSRQFGRSLHNQRFVGNEILFDEERRMGRAMKGFDYEGGILLPSEFARTHDLRVYAGGYHFYGSGAPDINGFRSRIEGDVVPSIRTQVEVTTDRTFGTNVMLGVTWTFSGAFERNWASTRPVDRMGEFVQRNYNVIVSRHHQRNFGLAAINPATGQPYTVQHVSTINGNSDGSFENPFQNVQDAQQAGSDFIFVHGGSVLTDPIALQPDEILLGEGVNHTLGIHGFGLVAMPKATASTDRPIIQGVSGDAVTLASNSVFSGFVIDAPAGNGLVGQNISGATVSAVEVRNAGQAGIRLDNVSGTVSLDGALVRNSGGNGIEITGGTANIEFLNSTKVENAGGSGVEIVDHSGSVQFDKLDVKAATGRNAVRIEGGAGHVDLGDVKLAAKNATALHVENAGSVSSVRGSIESDGGTAIDLENTTMDLRLTRLVSENASVGLRLVDAPGQFVVLGGTTDGSGGHIRHAGTAVVLDNVGSVGLRWFDIDQNNTGIQADRADYLALVASRVTNTSGQAVDLQDVRVFDLTTSIFGGNGAPGQSLIRHRATQNATYTINIDDTGVIHNRGDVLDIEALAGASGANLVLNAVGNEFHFTAAGSTGIRADWNGSMEATLVQNSLLGNGGNNLGIDLHNRSTNGSTMVFASNNLIDMAGAQGTGARLTTAGASQISLRDNLVQLNGANGTGLRFDLAESANVFLGSNIINDNVAGGTGMLFSSVAGPTQIRIDNNLIDLKGPSGINDRGIVFSSASGNVVLFSDQNNVIRNATTPYFAPIGAINGNIWINGEVLNP